MSWLRIESNFVKHPKVGRLSDRLKITKGEAGWLIMGALSWFSQFRPTGQVEGQHRDSDAGELEDFCDWPGARGEMLAAFIAAGLIDDTPADGGFEYHNWPEYQGKVKATAEKERKRKADYRAKKAAEKAGREVSVSLEMSRGTSDGTNTGRPALRNGTGRDGTERSSSYEDDEASSPFAPGVAFFDWFQSQRLQLGWSREEEPPRKDLDEFFNGAGRRLNDDDAGTREALEVATRGYAKDPHWLKAALPWAGFVAQWARHVRSMRHPGDPSLVVDRTESQEFPEGSPP